MPKHKKIEKLLQKGSPGQTMIETIVGIGLMTTGIIGGMALAIYSIGASDYSLKQIVATNLAREGVEVVRNMRDSNWLKDNLTPNCNQIANGQPCHNGWDDYNPGGYDVSGSTGSGTDYALTLLGNSWLINSISLGCQNRVFQNSDGLYYQSIPIVFFCLSNNGTSNQYYRRITIIRDATSGFSAQNPRLLVRSTVWWKGKRCPAASDNPPAANNCKVVMEEYLTNWKNY
jgi:hypothetical protein